MTNANKRCEKVDCPGIKIGASKNRGTPKWMVYNGKTLLKWMIWGYHYFWKHPNQPSVYQIHDSEEMRWTGGSYTPRVWEVPGTRTQDIEDIPILRVKVASWKAMLSEKLQVCRHIYVDTAIDQKKHAHLKFMIHMQDMYVCSYVHLCR